MLKPKFFILISFFFFFSIMEGIFCLRQLQSLGVGLVFVMAGSRCSPSGSVSLFWLHSQLSLHDSKGATSNWKYSSLSQLISKKRNYFFFYQEYQPKFHGCLSLAWLGCGPEVVMWESKTSLLVRTESHAHLWGHNLCRVGFF